MLAIARVACGLLLLWWQCVTAMGQLADPDYHGDTSASEVFEVLPDTSWSHY